MKFSLLINIKMPTIVRSFIFIKRKNSCSVTFSKKEMQLSIISDLSAGQIMCSAELSMKNVLYLGACFIPWALGEYWHIR